MKINRGRAGNSDFLRVRSDQRREREGKLLGLIDPTTRGPTLDGVLLPFQYQFGNRSFSRQGHQAERITGKIDVVRFSEVAMERLKVSNRIASGSHTGPNCLPRGLTENQPRMDANRHE